MKLQQLKYWIVWLILFSAMNTNAQYGHNRYSGEVVPLTRILFVFDASQSMYGRWQSDVKMNIARNLMANVLDSLEQVENLELALRVYGHQSNYPPQVCTDTRLEVPFGPANTQRINETLASLSPKGTTPIAYALEQSANDFPACEKCRNIVILITDGIEECGGDPCAVSKVLQKKGVFLKPFIIGIGRNFKEAFSCVGTYFDASSEKAFRQALNMVISQALNSTTVQVNLLNTEGLPVETNVNMSFYDHTSGQLKYNFIHTMNYRGVPDTLLIDPLPTYDVVVQTTPEVHIDSVKLAPGKHTIVAADAPQGSLWLKVGSNHRSLRDLQGVVRQSGSHETLYVQDFGETKRYLTGLYDLEILTMPRLYIDSVEVSQSHTTIVDIPLPGIAVIQKQVNGYGSLFVERGERLEWVYDLQLRKIQESLVLQPGRYRILFRSRNTDKSIFTVERRFKIRSGSTTNINIYQD